MIKFWQRFKEDFSNLRSHSLESFSSSYKSIVYFQLWQYMKVQHKFPMGGIRLLFFFFDFCKKKKQKKTYAIYRMWQSWTFTTEELVFHFYSFMDATLTGIEQ